MFFNMMRQIGNELDVATAAFSHVGASRYRDEDEPIDALDLCMAPGGFTASVLEKCPYVNVSGLSLPLANGGHKMRVKNGDSDSRVRVQYLDITMLTADLCPSPPISSSSTTKDGEPLIPAAHPRAHLLIPDTRPYFTSPPSFDLVICDGQVLRTHTPALPENRTESTRLLCAQLAIAFTRLKKGGTLVIRLHRPDSWNCARLIRIVDSVSLGPVRLFKSKKRHADRSSFYLVSKGVLPARTAAKEAVEMWRRAWLAATLRQGEENQGENVTEWSDWEKGGDVHEFLENFGPRLIELAEPIWKIQADALEKAPYITSKN